MLVGELLLQDGMEVLFGECGDGGTAMAVVDSEQSDVLAEL